MKLAAEPTIVNHQSSSDRSIAGRPIHDTVSVHQQAGIAPVDGRYVLQGEIARGGMGIVVRAQDIQFQRPLALKIMRSSGDGALVQRFLEEARIAGQLQHPGIPPVHELGRLADGRLFFAMKLIAGRTLADMLRERPAPQADLPRMLKIFEQVAQTIAYAHAHGIVHRDLKPLNVMVGAFGEVQVLDWGLAKRLDQGSAIGGDAPTSGSVRPIHPGLAETVAPASGGDTDRELTTAGDVLGTPAYMPPEQARGETAAIDRRSDVFGLGAMLCEILTGTPPYQGERQSDVLERALRADLAPARARIEAAAADGELKSLCISCLEVDRQKRPSDASVVAEKVAGYLASVQQRLDEARAQEAAALVRAGEARRRLRLLAGLAAAVLLLVAGTAGARVWYIQDRAQQAAELATRGEYLSREVSTSLDAAQAGHNALHARLADARGAAELLSDLPAWQALVDSAAAAWKRADSVSAKDRHLLEPEVKQRLEALGESLKTDQQQLQLVQSLEEIRLATLATPSELGDLWLADPKYERVFRAAGYDFAAEEGGALADRIGRSPIRVALVSAIDFWCIAGGGNKALAIARKADPDKWRNSVRKFGPFGELDMLEKAAAEADTASQSPAMLAAVAYRIRSLGGDSRPLLERALVHHLRDFWLHFELAEASRDPVEQAAACRAALAVRPGVAYLVVAQGAALARQGKQAAAQACFSRARQLDLGGGDGLAHIAVALQERGVPDQALELAQAAVTEAPRSAVTHDALGWIHLSAARWDEAAAALERAIDLDPDFYPPYVSLGDTYVRQQRLEDALAAYQKAAALLQRSTRAFEGQGYVHLRKGQLEEAERAYRRAAELQPQSGTAHAGLALVHLQRGQLDLAQKEAQAAVLHTPNDAWAQLALGIVLRARRRFSDAELALQKATTLNPNDETAHWYLGQVLVETNRPMLAISSLQRAIDLNPANLLAQVDLGRALVAAGKLPEAEAALKAAIKRQPALAMAHQALGDLHKKRGETDEAAAAYRRAIEVGGNLPAADQAGFHRSLGELLRSQGELSQEAADALRMAVALDPRNVPTQISLSGTLASQRRFHEAEKHARLAVELNSKVLYAHFNLGRALCGQHRYDEGIASYRAALALGPNVPATHRLLGDALRAQKKLSEAEQSYRQAVEFAPRQGDYGWRLGVTLVELGRFDEAAAVFKEEADVNGENGPLLAVARHWQSTAERLAAAAAKLAAIERGEAQPESTQERLALAFVCLTRRQFAPAVRFYEEAFAANPKLQEEWRQQHHYYAALAAVQASTGAAGNSPAISTEEPTRLRNQALVWLRAGLTSIRAANPSQGPSISERLARWRLDPDFAAVRDEASLTSLPPAERQDWQMLWSDVVKELDRIGKAAETETTTP